jgi:hypothetical protein
MPRANFDLGPLSLTVNGAINGVYSVVNGVLNGVGVLTEPFDRYQGELFTLESALGPGAPEAMAATTLLGRASAGIRAAQVANAELEVVAAETVAPLNTRVILQGVTDRAVADLAANPALARELMSPGSYSHLVEGTSLAPASYGKAIERLTARYVARDTDLSAILEYRSRPFTSTPDFFGHEGYNLRLLDVTTEASRAIHLERSYGPATELVIHPGLPPDLVFPR